MQYKFRNLKTIEDKKVEGSCYLEVPNKVSDEWFGGEKVVDWQPSGNGQISLLSQQGNVVGRIYDHQI